MTKSPSRIRFDAFELNLDTGELRGPNGSTRLQPKPAQVLGLLLLRNGELVTREELRQSLWPDTQIEFDQGLNYCIRQIRSALGEEAGNGGLIETLPRRGYRVRGAVQPLAESLVEPRRLRFGFTVLVGLLVLVTVGAIWIGRPPAVSGSSTAARVRIAVLPLGSRPVDPESTELATRFTESLLVALTAAREGSLAILGPASTEVYVGSELSQPDIGRELDAEFVVSGLYRVEESTLFVQMIRTETGEHLYGRRFPIRATEGDEIIANIVVEMIADIDEDGS